jgi:hypothetical protein
MMTLPTIISQTTESSWQTPMSLGRMEHYAPPHAQTFTSLSRHLFSIFFTLLTMLTFPSCTYLVVVVYIPIRVSLVSHALYPPCHCMLWYYVFMPTFLLMQPVITLYPLMTLCSKQTSHLTFMFSKCLQIHGLYILFTPPIQFITLPPPTLLCLADLPCHHIDR